MYTDPGSGLVKFIASGPDAAFDSRTPFGYGRPPWIATASQLSSRIWGTEEGQALYVAELERLLDERWAGDSRVAQLDAWKALLRGVSTAEMRQGMADTREVLSTKEGDLRANLDGRFEVLPLRGEVCWVEIGTVDVAFTTTWGSYPNGDVFGGGEAVTAYEISGVDYPSTEDGVSAGYADDTTALWLTISQVAPETRLAPYVTFDLDRVADGATLALDGKSATGALMYLAPETGGQWQTAAYLAGGALTLDVAGVGRDAVWTGSLHTAVMGQEP